MYNLKTIWYDSMVVTDSFILIISISIHHCQLMFIFTLFIFIKYECNFIYNLMFFHLQIRCSSRLLDLDYTSSSTPGGLVFDWSAVADPMHDELCTYFVMLWFMITNIITVCSMLTQHKITVIYKHKTHMIQLVCSMNNIYSYKLSK